MRSTHTYAELEVSRAAFNEILQRIEESDPRQKRERLDLPRMVLDMAGIGLVRADQDEEQRSVTKEQLDAVYRERNLVVALAAKLALFHPGFFAWRGQHDPEDRQWEDDWRNIVFISLGSPDLKESIQLSWHIHDSDLDLFSFLPDLRDEGESINARSLLADGEMSPITKLRLKWDGHTTEEKYERIRRFVGALAAGTQADGAG